MKTDYVPDFTGKQVNVYTTHASNRSYLMEDVSLEVQAGRTFLIGRVSTAYAENVWAKGRLACIAWDCITQYLIFDSADQYRQEMERWNAIKENTSVS
jgi:hypothetical protein